jgi:hypothetical protein
LRNNFTGKYCTGMLRCASRYIYRYFAKTVKCFTMFTMFVGSGQGTKNGGIKNGGMICFTMGPAICFTICFTICLFISPDLDGNRGTSTICLFKKRMCPKTHTICFPDMFTICSFNSPDLDGNQGTRENKNVPRETPIHGRRFIDSNHGMTHKNPNSEKTNSRGPGGGPLNSLV